MVHSQGIMKGCQLKLKGGKARPCESQGRKLLRGRIEIKSPEAKGYQCAVWMRGGRVGAGR